MSDASVGVRTTWSAVVARLTRRWVNAVPYETSRMTGHEARALSASLRETDDAPAALTGA
ncbi:hypothetical protein [Streptomyces sp. NPDC017673]|uniref:hypothetical protein n=1 Tax=unclassified Streptomyces TaxID=2593676 RepID=UPI0037A0037A